MTGDPHVGVSKGDGGSAFGTGPKLFLPPSHYRLAQEQGMDMSGYVETGAIPLPATSPKRISALHR